MILVDTALKRRESEGRPIQAAIVGAGFMGQGIARQFLTPLDGIRLAAISSRSMEKAAGVFRHADVEPTLAGDSLGQVQESLQHGRPVAVDDPSVACRADQIDVVIECTGQIDFGAKVAAEAIDHGKHVIMVNSELDATLGPILKTRADRVGVVLTNTDGDEPGVIMNLFRFVQSVGYRPVLAGNIKSFLDPYRDPDTQREFAERVNQSPKQVASYADGSKLAMEMTVVANATGFRAGRRGMFGPRCDHVKDIIRHFSPEQLLERGLVDYALGAAPGSGAFVVGYDNDDVKKQRMQYFKMGDGPLYVFYWPFVLPHLQIAETVGRAALFGDATATPLGGPVCDVVSIAKRNLLPGETLDGKGGFATYGVIENADAAAAERLLPLGLSEGCRLVRAVEKDHSITYDDVERPQPRFCDQLREEQDKLFHGLSSCAPSDVQLA